MGARADHIHMAIAVEVADRAGYATDGSVCPWCASNNSGTRNEGAVTAPDDARVDISGATEMANTKARGVIASKRRIPLSLCAEIPIERLGRA